MESKKKILIIDDDPDIIKIVKFRLQYEGYEVFEAHEGAQGLEKVRSVHPDLVLLDLIMPKMTGYEVLQALKLDEALKDIPVLVLTVQNKKCDKKFGFSMGASGYICKPFVSEELIEKVKEMIG